MNSLPHELVDQIVSYLPREDLKHVLTLSSKFQHVAEKYSGAFDLFDLSEKTAPQFLEKFGGHRFRYLQHISFRTSVLALDKADGQVTPLRDNEEELQKDDECFSNQIRFLFSTIKTLEDRATPQHGPGKLVLTIFTPYRDTYRGYHSIYRSYVSWRVHLLQPGLLPCLSSVHCLRVVNGISFKFDDEMGDISQRKLDLRVLVDLSTKLPNLVALQCNIGGDEWMGNHQDPRLRYVTKDWAGPRRDSRHDFARTLEIAALPRTLRDARLDFIDPFGGARYFDHREAFPNLTTPETYDIFSSSLRVFSYRLRRLSLKAIVDHTLFWPADESLPYWPNLEILNVTFHIVTPSGEWYFNGSKNEGSKEGFVINESDYPSYTESARDRESYEAVDDDWQDTTDRQYRIIPNNDTLVPFLNAFAMAANYMPRLKQALLWAPVYFNAFAMTNGMIHETLEGLDFTEITKHIEGGHCKPLAWGIVYTAPNAKGFKGCRGGQDENTRQIRWNVAGWRPDAALHRKFTEIGQDKYGTDFAEYWEDDHNGTGLAKEDEFKRFESQLFRTYYPEPFSFYPSTWNRDSPAAGFWRYDKC